MAQTMGIQVQRMCPTTIQSVYTVPSGNTYIPKTILFKRIDFGANTNSEYIKLYFVPPGGTYSNENLVEEIYIDPLARCYVDCGMFLQEGYQIYVVAQIGIVNVQISGVLIS